MKFTRFFISALTAVMLLSFSVSAENAPEDLMCSLEPIEEEQLSPEEAEQLLDYLYYPRYLAAAVSEKPFPACEIYSSQLTSEEFDLYRQICSAYELLLRSDSDLREQKFASIAYDNNIIDKAALKKIYYVFYYSNPQYFFAYNGYSSGTAEDGTAILVLKVYKQFTDGKFRCTVRDEIEKKAQRWLDEAELLDNDLEKERYIAEIICETVSYDKTAQLNQSLAGALYYGSCVCNGYAMAMNYLCSLAGLETFTVVSKNHAWNVTELYGNYYQIDTTWMDSSYEPSMWINKGTEAFSAQDKSGSHNIDMTNFSGMTLPPLTRNDTDDTVFLDEFPDKDLRLALSELLDTDGSGGLCLNEYARAERLDISGRSISDISGIKLIPSVRSLDCSYNSIMFADLSETALADSTFSANMNIFNARISEDGNILLPSGFDISRSSEWTGGRPLGPAVTNISGNRISYAYDCGNGIRKTFLIHAKRSSDPMEMLADNISFSFGSEDVGERLGAGESLFDILSDIGRKYPDSGEFAKWLYIALLGRFPDKAGLESWCEALDSGYSLKYLISGFLCSEEFMDLAAESGFSEDIISVPFEDMRTGEELAEALYIGFLHRKPTNGESDIWKNMSDPADIVRGIIGSDEYRFAPLPAEEFIGKLYFILLERAPDPEGFAHWKSVFIREGAFNTAEMFASSEEFTERHITNT